MTTATVRPATIADVYMLAPRLRQADKAEIKALTGQSPQAALTDAFERSESPQVITAGTLNVPIGMFGVAPSGDDPMVGLAWLLASDDLKDHSRAFLRECRSWVNALHLNFPVLFHVTGEGNTLHQRWLYWCGFSCTKRHEALGVEQRPFLEFVHVKPQCSDEDRPAPK